MGHFVYKYVNSDGEVLYVGKTDSDLLRRLYQHGRPGDNIDESAWPEINNCDVFYTELANATMSDVVESELIRRYKPRYNKAKMSDWQGLLFAEPSWIRFSRSTLKNTETIERLKNRITELEESIDRYDSAVRDLSIELKNKCNNCEERKMHYKFKDTFIKERNSFSWSLANDSDMSEGKTWESIVDEYRGNPHLPINYHSVAYNYNGLITCEKNIYTNAHGMLCFSFSQIKCCKDVHGTILVSPSDKMSNYTTLKTWGNRGDPIYYRRHVYDLSVPKPAVEPSSDVPGIQRYKDLEFTDSETIIMKYRSDLYLSDCYVSEAYDVFGNLVLQKFIYTDDRNVLKFRFLCPSENRDEIINILDSDPRYDISTRFYSLECSGISRYHITTMSECSIKK